MSERRSAPRLTATYRVQLNASFRFDDARAIVGYLHRLGVSHLYQSPVLRARAGSTHGYDVVDPREVNPELGTDADRRALARALAQHDMGVLLDIVPNHMGTGPENPFWEDVLTHGRASRWAGWFDVDWRAPEPELRERVMLPVLGDELDAVLARDDVRVVFERGRFRVAYFDHRFPLDPTTVHRLFAFHHQYTYPEDDRDDADEMLALRDALLPEGGAALDRAAAEQAVARLAELAERSPAQREYVEWVLRAFSAGEDGHYRLRALLDLQNYALAFWRRAATEIDYRRFFDVNELVALRASDPEVFRDTHALVLSWVADGTVDGLRVDHVDGLLDPAGYLERLREELEARRPGEAVPLFVEKILSPGEQLRHSWPVDGTTGYEFLNDLEALFISPDGASEIEGAYRALLRLGPQGPRFPDVASYGKQKVLRGALQADVRRLARLLRAAVRRRAPESRLPFAVLAEGVLQLIAALPVYRTYVDGRTRFVHPDDRAVVERAVARVREREGPMRGLVELLRALLLGAPAEPEGEARAEGLRFVGRFQQTSGPATAKGVEDTALYLYVPLASRNEVGGEPDRDLEGAPAALHRANAERAARWPRHLLATNTHDTKRSADVRARLDALSEMPAEWAAQVARWRRDHRPLRETIGTRRAPDANTEYLLYQTLVGVWPFGAGRAPDAGERAALRERVDAYMLKAAREGKTRTSWTDPDEAFEGALSRFVRALVEDDAGAAFRADLTRLVARVAPAGMWTALSRVLVHLTAPGTPDLYQGDELWSFALVDPDNRRPVDYALRDRLLAELERREPGPELARELVADAATAADGRAKLHLTRAALHARRADPELFAAGQYVPLVAEGARAAHVFAFARRAGRRTAVTVVPRLTLGLSADGAPPLGAAVWGDTAVRLPDDVAAGELFDTAAGTAVSYGGPGAALRVADLLSHFPVALLLSERRPELRE